MSPRGRPGGPPAAPPGGWGLPSSHPISAGRRRERESRSGRGGGCASGLHLPVPLHLAPERDVYLESRSSPRTGWPKVMCKVGWKEARAKSSWSTCRFVTRVRAGGAAPGGDPRAEPRVGFPSVSGRSRLGPGGRWLAGSLAPEEPLAGPGEERAGPGTPGLTPFLTPGQPGPRRPPTGHSMG